MIRPDDPPPFELIKESGKAQIVICSDHAAGAVPQALATLGMGPSEFDSHEEYERRARMLVEVGLVEDATKILLNVRPHASFPTLEMPITDICTRPETRVTIAALYVCLVSLSRHLRRENQRWRVYSNKLLRENRWLAQRYRYVDGLVDFGRVERIAYSDLFEKIIEVVGEDARELRSLAEVKRAREIVSEGNSAHCQSRSRYPDKANTRH